MSRGSHDRCSPADDVLVEALRCVLTGSDRSEVKGRLLGIPGKGELLLQRADDEGVSGILAEVLADQNRTPHKLQVALQSRRHRIFAHGAHTLDWLDRLGTAFAQSGLQAVALKGAALLAGCYRDSLGRRPVSDIDLLVRRQELGPAKAVFAGLGLRPLGPRWRGDGIEIDLHTDLVCPQLIGQRHTAYRFPSTRVWETSLACAIGGPAIRVLAPELQILHLAVHGVKHAFSRWIWLIDLAQLIPSAKPEALLTTATAVRGERALAYCAELLGRRLGHPTLFTQISPLPPLSRLETQWLRLVADRRGPIGLGRIVAGLSIPGPIDRLAYWKEVALPSAKMLRLATPHTSGRHLRRRWLTQTLAPRLGEAIRLIARTASSLRP